MLVHLAFLALDHYVNAYFFRREIQKEAVEREEARALLFSFDIIFSGAVRSWERPRTLCDSPVAHQGAVRDVHDHEGQMVPIGRRRLGRDRIGSVEWKENDDGDEAALVPPAFSFNPLVEAFTLSVRPSGGVSPALSMHAACVTGYNAHKTPQFIRRPKLTFALVCM